jgi:hypothetical protein
MGPIRSVAGSPSISSPTTSRVEILSRRIHRGRLAYRKKRLASYNGMIPMHVLPMLEPRSGEAGEQHWLAKEAGRRAGGYAPI